MDIRTIIPNIKDQEDVLAIFHQFWLVFFWQWIGAAVLFLSPFFFLALFLRWGVYGSALLIVLFLLGAWWMTRIYRIWFYSMLIITSKRLLVVTQSGFFDRAVSQVELDKITDVSYRKKGAMRTLFDVGAVSIQASGTERLMLSNLKRPSDIQQVIFDARDENAAREIVEYSESDLLAIIKEIRLRVGAERWGAIMKGDWELKQELINEVHEEDDEKARIIEDFFSQKTQ